MLAQPDVLVIFCRKNFRKTKSEFRSWTCFSFSWFSHDAQSCLKIRLRLAYHMCAVSLGLINPLVAVGIPLVAMFFYLVLDIRFSTAQNVSFSMKFNAWEVSASFFRKMSVFRRRGNNLFPPINFQKDAKEFYFFINAGKGWKFINLLKIK